jgi:hypothetical protein
VALAHCCLDVRLAAAQQQAGDIAKGSAVDDQDASRGIGLGKLGGQLEEDGGLATAAPQVGKGNAACRHRASLVAGGQAAGGGSGDGQQLRAT